MKFVRSMLVFCAVTALVGGAPGAALAANLVQNGDFSEYTNFTPTNANPYTIFSPKNGSNVVVAHWSVSFNGDNRGVSIWCIENNHYQPVSVEALQIGIASLKKWHGVVGDAAKAYCFGILPDGRVVSAFCVCATLLC